MAEWMPYPWQQAQWQHLQDQHKQGRLPHALLFYGEEGCGKLSLAQGFVKQLLCQQDNEFPCGICKSCQLFDAETHPDFLKISLEEKSRQIKVDQIRQVVDFVSKTAQMSGNKLLVIEPAETMNINASNALLKCLEEPAQNTFIILVSHAPNRLLPTIRSRCQDISLQKPTRNVADRWLATFVNEPALREQLLMLANGNPLRAYDYYENDVQGIYRDIIDKLLALKSGQQSLVTISEAAIKQNVSLWLQMNQVLVWQMIRLHLGNRQEIPSTMERFTPLIQAKGFLPKAYHMLEEVQQAISDMQSTTNPNPQLLVESILVLWQALFRSF